MWNATGSHSGWVQGSGRTSTVQGGDYCPDSPGGGPEDRARGRSRSPVRKSTCLAPGINPQGAQSPGFNGSKYELQQQHVRLKRKFEERKKRYEQEKEAWAKEKEALLREVLEMQAGENRRILLDLKSLLQVVQIQLRKEEKKQSSLKLQYSSDRCAWELERAQLKCHISQLESKANRTCSDKRTPNHQEALKTEREDQKRLVADTHSAAMDLRKQLESTERDWKMEKMQLLERFDSERKEWECQWKVMQKKIEELYQEVKLRRESNGKSRDEAIKDKIYQFSVHSPCSEYTRQSGSAEDGSHLPNKDIDLHQSVSKQKINELFVDYLVCDSAEKTDRCSESKMSKKENGTLNEALSEIAKVSKELCSYQEEIRKTSHRRRLKSYPLLGEYEEPEKMSLASKMSLVSSSVQQASSAMSQTEVHNRKNQNGVRREMKNIPCSGINGELGQKGSPTFRNKEAPPIPPRGTSGHLSSSLTVCPPAYDVSTQELSCSWVSQQCKSGYTIGGTDFLNKSKATSQAGPGMSSNDVGRGSSSPFLDKKGIGSKCNGDIRQSPRLHRDGKLGKETDISSIESMDLKQNTTSHAGLNHINGWSANTALPRDDEGKFGENLEQYLSGGKLAAKTDEFNRIVFQTNKCSNALQDSEQSLMFTGNQKHCSNSLCGCRDNSVDIENAVGGSSPSPLACRKLGSSCPVGSIKISGQPKQINGFHSSSSYQQMLYEHDWRPSNLSGRPRSADSRSNYGVVEKLLKNYEKSAGPSLYHAKGPSGKRTLSGSVCRDRSSETLSHYLEMLQIDQPTPELQRNTAVSSRHPCKQETGKLSFPEMPSPGKSSSRKGFSRPARPANRRLPSRWASRSSSAPLSFGGCEHSYSFAFLSETSVV